MLFHKLWNCFIKSGTVPLCVGLLGYCPIFFGWRFFMWHNNVWSTQNWKVVNKSIFSILILFAASCTLTESKTSPWSQIVLIWRCCCIATGSSSAFSRFPWQTLWLFWSVYNHIMHLVLLFNIGLRKTILFFLLHFCHWFLQGMIHWSIVLHLAIWISKQFKL